MNALKQYIDLFRDHSGLIDANSAGPLNSLRGRACRILEGMRLPAEGSENYENIDLQKILAPDYGINLSRIDIDVNPAASFRCEVPHLSSSLFLNINDCLTETENCRKTLPEGVIAGSLKEIAKKNPELIENFYGRIADMNNPVVALDTLLNQDGFFLLVKKNVKVEKPIQLVNILQNGMPLMAIRRILIVMEENSEAKLLVCDHTQNPDVDFLALSTVEIFAGAGSRLDYYDLEESTERTTRLSALYLDQKENSDVLIDGMTLFNGTTRNEYKCVFSGEHSKLKLLGMGIEDRERVLSNFSRIEHHAKDCHSDELFKYVVEEKARGAFTGLIYVAPGAEKTEAYQSNRNLVGSDTAQMYSKPQLEIYNDDVKCSHGTATGQLDELQLFYMRTRGLDEATARLLLKQAFMADVVDGVRLTSLKDRLHHLIELRFSGRQSSCASCAACHNDINDQQK